ncbi:hypothetical protein WR25_09379 [Diploscapter pachys]|uniref:Uncharacterized protein n=1 Tax=Diploscapter pachys TaxID=2018661 RepID=A0A2A2M2W7_9BILA|nr:hypothetical protein WR25_09379 [Diploscapter pachys]
MPAARRGSGSGEGAFEEIAGLGGDHALLHALADQHRGAAAQAHLARLHLALRRDALAPGEGAGEGRRLAAKHRRLVGEREVVAPQPAHLRRLALARLVAERLADDDLVHLEQRRHLVAGDEAAAAIAADRLHDARQAAELGPAALAEHHLVGAQQRLVERVRDAGYGIALRVGVRVLVVELVGARQRDAQAGIVGRRVEDQRGGPDFTAHLDQLGRQRCGIAERVVAGIGVGDIRLRHRRLQAVILGDVGHLYAVHRHLVRLAAPADQRVGRVEEGVHAVLHEREVLFADRDARHDDVGDIALVLVGDGDRGERGVDGIRRNGHGKCVLKAG